MVHIKADPKSKRGVHTRWARWGPLTKTLGENYPSFPVPPIAGLSRRVPLSKPIRRVTVREGEFEKTTTQEIRRHLLHQEDTTH